MNLTTATPVEIDTELARLDAELHKAEAKLISAWNNVHHSAGDRKVYRSNRAVWGMNNEVALANVEALTTDETYIGSDARKAIANLAEAASLIEDIKNRGNAHRAEYARRPWSRAFLAITNGAGHVHSSMDCSTCNNGINRTMFGWQPQYSGADQATIIADAGYRACTVCFPDAPVGDAKSLPTKMFTADEITAAEARTARAAEKAAREAKKIEKALTLDGSELVIRTEQTRESFKTEVAGRNWLVGELGYNKARGSRKDDEAIAIVLEALATKHGVTVEEERTAIDAKVEAWIRRNFR